MTQEPRPSRFGAVDRAEGDKPWCSLAHSVSAPEEEKGPGLFQSQVMGTEDSVT